MSQRPSRPFSSFNRREPVFNLPLIIMILTALLVGLHLWLHYGMNPWQRAEFFWQYGFIPRFLHLMFQPPEFQLIDDFPFLSVLFSLVSYSFLHGDWLHLGFNLIWLIIFGAPLSQHLGNVRFLLFWLVTAILSALAHFAVHSTSPIVMVGASGVVSALMGAAARYGFYRSHHRQDLSPSLLPMQRALMDKSSLSFLGGWLVVNLAVGLGMSVPGIEDANIAWEAHIGGLIAGFVLIGCFDGYSRRQGRGYRL